jgi:hypothetical protein
VCAEFEQRVKYPLCCLYHCHCDIWLVCLALASTLFPCQSLPLSCTCVLRLSSLWLSLCSRRAVSTVDDDFFIYYLHNRSGQNSLGNPLIRKASCELSGSGDQRLSDQLPVLRPGHPSCHQAAPLDDLAWKLEYPVEYSRQCTCADGAPFQTECGRWFSASVAVEARFRPRHTYLTRWTHLKLCRVSSIITDLVLVSVPGSQGLRAKRP